MGGRPIKAIPDASKAARGMLARGRFTNRRHPADSTDDLLNVSEVSGLCGESSGSVLSDAQIARLSAANKNVARVAARSPRVG